MFSTRHCWGEGGVSERMTGLEVSQKWGAPDTPPKISPENPLKKWWVVWFFSHETTSVRGSSSWSLESPEMEVLSANSIGNFTGPCESAKGGWSCNQRTTWDEFSVKPLSSPPLLSIMTKIIPIFTPHQSHGLPETTFFHTSTIKNTPKPPISPLAWRSRITLATMLSAGLLDAALPSPISWYKSPGLKALGASRMP